MNIFETPLSPDNYLVQCICPFFLSGGFFINIFNTYTFRSKEKNSFTSFNRNTSTSVILRQNKNGQMCLILYFFCFSLFNCPLEIISWFQSSRHETRSVHWQISFQRSTWFSSDRNSLHLATWSLHRHIKRVSAGSTVPNVCITCLCLFARLYVRTSRQTYARPCRSARVREWSVYLCR